MELLAPLCYDDFLGKFLAEIGREVLCPLGPTFGIPGLPRLELSVFGRFL